MSDNKKPRQSPSKKPAVGKGQPASAPGKPSLEHHIGDKIDINSETRGTGPRNPIKGKLSGKD